jgi:addiction module RelE/StbE family toxin
LFEDRANDLLDNPNLYKPGRMKGTREAVVHPSYVMIYETTDTTITVIRVLHASQHSQLWR